MVIRTRAFRFFAEMKNVVDRVLYCNAYTNKSPSNVASRPPSRFRTKVACIKNNVLLFFFSLLLFSLYRFLVCPMFRFPNRPDTCYERAIHPSYPSLLSSPLLSSSPSLPEMFWLHERGARINFSLLRFLVSFLFFFKPTLP